MQFKQTYPTPAEHSAGKNTCEFVIVHHTGTPAGTITGVLDGLYRRPDYASCHYVVDVNGDVYKIGNDTDILWHAGVSSWQGKSDMNRYSIGIEVIGIDSFTDAQRTAVKRLVEELMQAHAIPRKNVLRHADIAPGRKTDINLAFCAPKTWAEWQTTLLTNLHAMLLDENIQLLKKLYPVVSPALQAEIAALAKKDREAQAALGEPVTP